MGIERKPVAVLAVDDTPANLTAIEAALSDVRGSVVRAQSGDEALRLLLDRDFALVLLDVQMPSLDGFETARLIRSRKRSRYTPIVFMTAFGGDDADVLGAYELGAVDFLFKPVAPEMLRAKVNVFIDLYARSCEVQEQAALIREHERREHERMLQAQREHWEAEALRRQMAHLARADAYKDRFLAVLGHELRNPLSSVVTGLEVLRDRLSTDRAPVDAAMRKTRDIIDRQAKHLTSLLDDLLDITRISSGKIRLRREPVLVSNVIEQAVNTSQPMMERSAQALSVRVSEEPLIVDADPTRLLQIIVNLLANASRYTPAGGSISLVCEPQKGGVSICVSDNGRGISADFMPHIFDAFSQETGQAGAGLGVGLSVVRQLIALHGGTVAAHSDGPGMGSSFTIWLPLAPDVSAQTFATLSRPTPIDHVSPVTTQPLSVVLIDDNEDLRELMAQLMRTWGHRVETASDGESGVALALRSRPDVTFVDIGLPKLDGYGVASALRSVPDINTRLVAMTGFGQESDRQRAVDSGFERHLVKPASIEALQAALRFDEHAR